MISARILQKRPAGSCEAMLVEGEFGEAGAGSDHRGTPAGGGGLAAGLYRRQPLSADAPAQDHKRLLDGDLGPNTGGMGAYAPAPVCTPELVDEISRTVLAANTGRAAGRDARITGVLYAGLMLTAGRSESAGVQLPLWGPETQVILPLLESDLLEIALACTKGTLDDLTIEWEQGAAACVVLASQGYPGKVEKGLPVTV